MDETPKQKDKRKLESPGTNSPIYKQSKMAGSPDQADVSTNLGSLSTRMDQMFEILNSVKKGQDGLRQMFDSKIDKLRKDALSTIDDIIQAVKVDVDLQFAAIDRRIDELEHNMRSFALLDGMRDMNNPQNNQSVSNDELTVIVSNLREARGEDPLVVAQSLLNALGEEVSNSITVIDAQRLPERNRGKPRLNSTYGRVYIRSSKSHVECLLELNTKTFLSKLPNGHLYRVSANGRILKKDNASDNRNQNTARNGSD